MSTTLQTLATISKPNGSHYNHFHPRGCTDYPTSVTFALVEELPYSCKQRKLLVFDLIDYRELRAVALGQTYTDWHIL